MTVCDSCVHPTIPPHKGFCISRARIGFVKVCSCRVSLADEATEVPERAEDELEAMFKKKKKRRVLEHTEKRRIVDNLLAQVCADSIRSLCGTVRAQNNATRLRNLCLAW